MANRPETLQYWEEKLALAENKLIFFLLLWWLNEGPKGFSG
jgi:hypothetical protein